MVLAMPTSVSELSRHSMRAAMGNRRFRFPDGVAKLRRKVRAHGDELEIDIGWREQIVQTASRDGCSRRGRR